jgi:predicted ATPase/serine phosphatase RsbU (regulator of sigma subunit)
VNSIQRFKISDIIYDSERTLVYHAFDTEKELPVILKLFRIGVHSLQEIKRFEHEFEISSRLQIESVVQPYEIVETNSQLAIVYEDYGGISIREYIAGSAVTTEDFLELSQKIVKALADIHRFKIIHRDINPSNVLINRETRVVKITDFGIALPFQARHYNTTMKNTGMGTLAYMAPEQAGRMNRPVDYRSDYYSMGIMLYEMLTGRLPFITDEPSELLYCHIAKEPQDPGEINPEIPSPLSSIVLKLIEKMPEERYQSSEGLLLDLRECEKMFNETGYITDFPVATHDFSHTFSVSHSIIGRERELDTLKNSFDWVRNNHTEMVLVTGSSGVGKSTLIKELDRYTARFTSYFISGNADRFHKNTPYYCIRTVLTDLVSQILTESSSQIEKWKKSLLSELDDNAPLLAEFAPEFVQIIGQQKRVELTEIEREIHYRIMLQRLFSAIATQEHPVVIVIENIHWIDMAALNFIHLIMISRTHKNTMIVGSSRKKDLTDSHPLMVMIKDINQQGRRIVQQIDLQELSVDEVNKVVADSLKTESNRTLELAQEIFSKTGGNPFFVRELLTTLYDDGVFQFDHEHGHWTWNHVLVKEKHFTKNIIDHMADKIEMLDNKFKEPLIFASCIGISFSIEVLSEICRKSPEYILDAMDHAINEGLITHDGVSYRFTHERVKQAANIFLTEDQKQVIHRQIGHFLLENKSNDFDQYFFDIVNHMNYAIPLVVDPDEKLFLAELNREAGKRAKEAAAYTNSYRYFQTGVKLLDQTDWDIHYNLIFALHKGAVQAALLSGESSLIDTYVDRVMSNSQNVVHKAEMIDMKIHAYVSQNRLTEAVNNALMVLSILDIQIPKNSNRQLLQRHFLSFRKKIPSSLPKILNYKLMSDEMIQTVSKILAGISATVFHVRPEVYPLFILKHLDITIAYGNSVYAPQLYAEYGMMLCQIGKIDDGIHYAKIALAMSQKERYNHIKSRVKTIVYGFIVPWSKENSFHHESMMDIYKQAVEEEDFEYAALAAFIYCSQEFFKGSALTVVLRNIAEFTDMITTLNQYSVLPYMRMLKQAILNFIEDKGNPHELIGDAFNENKFFSEEKSGGTISAVLYFLKGLVAHIFNDSKNAEDFFNKSFPNKVDQGFNIIIHQFDYYYSLSLCAKFEISDSNEQRRIRKVVQQVCEKYKKWSDKLSSDFLARYYLISAEYQRINQNYQRADHFYELALAQCADLDRTLDFAMFNELAGLYYLFRKKRTVARTLLQEAFDTYQRWGAVRKSHSLLKKYADFIQNYDYSVRDVYHRNSTITSTSSGKDIDINAILSASHVLSSEINYTRLVEKLMNIIMKHSGAVRGSLVVQQDGVLSVEAESHFIEDIETRVESRVLNEKSSLFLPVTVINYVSRIRETIVLDDTSEENMFSHDEYISQVGKCSIVTIPIIHHDILIGLLYLENNLATGIFSGDRVKLLELICSQAAISIQNSKLYNRLEDYSKKLENKVQRRTSELEKVNENLLEINQLLLDARIEAEHDMEMAANVQLSFLPTKYTDVEKWDIEYSFKPMTGVSGDFYDFYEKDGKLLGVGLFDVSGHGISSGLITVIARSIVHRHFISMVDRPLNEVIETINEMFIQEIGHTNNYLTGILLRFNNGRVEYVNAAHPSIIKYDKKTDSVFEVNKDDDDWRGHFLGIPLMRTTFGVIDVEMESGDFLVIFSDCLSEGVSEKGEIFGYKGVISAIDIGLKGTSKEILENLTARYTAHVGKTKLDDDYTVVVVKKK